MPIIIFGNRKAWTLKNDVTFGKNITADSNHASYPPSNTIDDLVSTHWETQALVAFPHWLRVDLGSNNALKIRKLRFIGIGYIRNFKLQGSNNDSTWSDIYTGTGSNNTNWQDYTFTNDTAYRYLRLYIINSYNASEYCYLKELELIELT